MNNVTNQEALERAARLMKAYQKKLNLEKEVLLFRPDEEEKRVKMSACEGMINRIEDYRMETSFPEVADCWLVFDERTILAVGDVKFLLGPIIIKKEVTPGFLADIDNEDEKAIQKAIYDRLCILCEGDRELKVIKL